MSRTTVDQMHLRDLIGLAAAAFEECNRCELGHVERNQLDEDGCNWHFDRVTGENCLACATRLRATVEALQRLFNVQDLDLPL